MTQFYYIVYVIYYYYIQFVHPDLNGCQTIDITMNPLYSLTLKFELWYR